MCPGQVMHKCFRFFDLEFCTWSYDELREGVGHHAGGSAQVVVLLVTVAIIPVVRVAVTGPGEYAGLRIHLPPQRVKRRLEMVIVIVT